MSMATDLGNGWLQVDSHYISEGHTAVYLVGDAGRWAVLDTANSAAAPRIVEALEAAGASAGDVDAVLVTHAHLDHCGGAGALMEELPNATLYAHAKALPHIIEPTQLIAGSRDVYLERFDGLYGTILPVEEARTAAVGEGDKIKVGGRELEVIDTPGHTFSHVCALDRAADVLFAGDTFGVSWPPSSGSAGGLRVPAAPTQFSPREWRESVERIAGMGAGRIALSHFGLVQGDISARRQELLDEIDAFVELARKVKGADNAPARVGEGVLEIWRNRFGAEMDAVEKSVVHNDMNLCKLGISLWMDRHLGEEG